MNIVRELGDSRWLATALNDLGSVLSRIGDFIQAYDMHKQALLIQEQELGIDAHDTIATRAKLEATHDRLQQFFDHGSGDTTNLTFKQRWYQRRFVLAPLCLESPDKLVVIRMRADPEPDEAVRSLQSERANYYWADAQRDRLILLWTFTVHRT